MGKEVKNILGRTFPEKVFGNTLRPYKGIHASSISGKRVGPAYQKTFINPKTKRVFDSFDTLFQNLPLRDGMCISFHHALRDGEGIILPIIERMAAFEIKNIALASTALFPVHAPLEDYIQSGTVSRIEGSVNGPLGNAISREDIEVQTILPSCIARVRPP